jgi:hypothetical protein
LVGSASGWEEAEGGASVSERVTSRNVRRLVALYAGSVVFGYGQPNRLEGVMSDPAADDGDGVDPAVVQTLRGLADAFQRLRGSRSYAELDRAVNPDRNPRGLRLAGSTLSNLLRGESVPTRETVTTFLAACGLDEEGLGPWLAAWDRVRTAHLHRPVGAVRVRDARARLLGVHSAIEVEGAAGELPEYVLRDIDQKLRDAIKVAAEHGGLVLLVGGSSVGKTRTLFEAVRAVVPEWWLLRPHDASAVVEFATRPTHRTVVWLDELQRYLQAPGGLPAGAVRDLIAAKMVLAGTLWPDEHAKRIELPMTGQGDLCGDDRELLRMGEVINVLEAFSPSERRRAEALADTDRRLRIALDSSDAGFTQVLAAGPELIRRWETAPTPYGKAVITAALDARRVGATAPLTRALLKAAAPAYLTSAQQAAAPKDWLDQALDYATKGLHGSAATLTMVSAGMSRLAGYATADYLYQHARRVRRTTPLPDRAWQALVDHHHPDDTLRLADNADRRMKPQYADVLFRKAADTDFSARVLTAYQTVDLLIEQGRTNEAAALVRDVVYYGEPMALDRVIRAFADRGCIDEAAAALRPQVDDGDSLAEDKLIRLLTEHGRIEEAVELLRPLADHGKAIAAYRLARLFAKQGHTDEAVTLLQGLVNDGEKIAVFPLAHLLGKQENGDRTATLLEAIVGNVDFAALAGFVDIMVEENIISDVALLRNFADLGHTQAAYRLLDLLATQDRIEELEAEAHAGTHGAAQRLRKIEPERRM